MVAVRVDEVGIDRGPAAVAEDPSGLPPQWPRRHQLELLHELNEVRVCVVVVRSGCDEVMMTDAVSLYEKSIRAELCSYGC